MAISRVRHRCTALSCGAALLLAAVFAPSGCSAGAGQPDQGGEGGSAGAAVDCGPGATLCGTTCTLLALDPANCGECGHACAKGETCADGSCTATSCGTGTEKCGDECVALDHDPEHCGSCENACPDGQLCAAGQCAVSCAASGLTECSGQCVDTANDPKNCGDCEQACTPDQVCKSGQCASECGIGLSKCGEVCADTKTSEEHCGKCDNPCAKGEDCLDGVCQVCDPKTTDCDSDGWLEADGDCCDRSGSCGLEPELVNPGAIEVVGNGIDDNCNGKTDLFDLEDTVPCDGALASDSSSPGDYAKALGICRSTTETPALKDKTWGLIDAKLLKADGTPLVDVDARSIRQAFGSVSPATLEGKSMVVLSSGIAADATQTKPGPNGGAPNGFNVSNEHSPTSTTNLTTCTDPLCIKDWFGAPNPPLKAAGQLPVAPNCGSGSAGEPNNARDSAMLYLRLRAPTNVKAFSFNSYFLSAEYPEYVCTDFNDQFVALVHTPGGTPSPIPNPVDKNLMVYSDAGKKWPVGINIAAGTSLFSVCESQTANPSCWETTVSPASCQLGPGQLTGTGFEKSGSCLIGGGTYWLTTSGNIIPGDIVELRIAVWDVGDHVYDSLALVDGFEWLPNATVPGTD